MAHIESPGDVLAVEHADGPQMWTAAQEERRSAPVMSRETREAHLSRHSKPLSVRFSQKHTARDRSVTFGQ
ncbi:hypothetical protein R3I94_022970 [Phoxinus phoxinus]